MIASSPQPQPVLAAAVDEIVQEEFLALICADEDLLRAEFDAIITAGWDQPAPPQRPRRTHPPARHPPRRWRINASAGGLPGPQHEPGAEGRSRQRAPPGPARATGTRDHSTPPTQGGDAPA